MTEAANSDRVERESKRYLADFEVGWYGLVGFCFKEEMSCDIWVEV